MPSTKDFQSGIIFPSTNPDYPGPWTPATMRSYGRGMLPWREVRFGPYVFPLTAQEKQRSSKLPLDRIKIPFQYGEWASPFTSKGARELDYTVALGSGIVVGTNDSTDYPNMPEVTMTSDLDLENQRMFLESLQDQGTWPLYMRPDRYVNAFLAEFTHALMDGGSFRAAEWNLKFVAVDPRYYADPVLLTGGAENGAGPGHRQKQGGHGAGGSFTATPMNHSGNTFAWPVVTLTAFGNVTAPFFNIRGSGGGTGVQVTFSGLTGSKKMVSTDVLIVQCDPRPETRQNFVALLYRGGIVSPTAVENALQYINPATDFANNRNASTYFPYIDGQNDIATNDGTGQDFNVGDTGSVGGSGNLQWQIDWYDTWV